MTLASILLLGFALGIRHAMDADHLAAMATLATKCRSVTDTVRQGIAWGTGHTLVLLLFAGTVIMVGQAIPHSAAQSLEAVVGCMLVLLGAHTLYRVPPLRAHLHRHPQAAGADHLTADARLGRDVESVAERPDKIDTHGLPVRAVIVGMVHGLAGSAALILLSVQAVPSSGWALVYIVTFGLGSIVGMASLSALIAMPLRLSARYLARAYGLFAAAIGTSTVVLGACIVYRVGTSGANG